MPTKKDLISQLERACDGIEAYRDTENWSQADDEFLDETRAMIAEADAETLPGNAETDVIEERLRQVTKLGYTPERDDQYRNCELERAAACMAAGSPFIESSNPDGTDRLRVWPWGTKFWKKSLSYRQRLVQAAALLLAAIERLDREEKRNAS